jgi:aryl-alcohol dehydrogenase-like predicted oxidoreductase
VRQRRVGTTDLVVTEVGFPVWALAAGPEARPDKDAADLLGAALDLGIGYFAASDADEEGRAEHLLGAAVRGHRDEVTVATTFGYDTTPRLWEPTPEGPRHDWSTGFAGRALDRSLGRLGLEPIDLWLLHHPGMDALKSDELFQFLDQQVEKGKIRHYGVALGPGPGWGDEGAAALRDRRVAAVETVYNVAEQDPARELAALAAETGAGLVVRDPLAPRLSAAARERLAFLARDRSLDQALLRFALADPAVATVLPPVPDRWTLAELAAADLDPPTAEDLDAIADWGGSGGPRRPPRSDPREARFGVGPGAREAG